jgi:hypothetical protein
VLAAIIKEPAREKPIVINKAYGDRVFQVTIVPDMTPGASKIMRQKR